MSENIKTDDRAYWTTPKAFADRAINVGHDRGLLENLFKEAQEVAIDAALDRMGWTEINAFNAELARGQSVMEDAGGFFIRCIRALFGLAPVPEVTTYQDAGRAMVKAARDEIRRMKKTAQL